MDINFNKNEDAIKLKIAEMKRRLVKISLEVGKRRLKKNTAKVNLRLENVLTTL